MATWMTGKCLALDTETTGVSVFDDRIVTACAAIVAPDGTVEFQRDWLIAPDIDISPGASEKNGITTEYASEHGMPPEQGIKEIANAVRYAVHSRMPVVAFNASFDLSILSFECARRGLGTLAEFCDREVFPVVDPAVIDKAVDRFRPGSRKLDAVCAHYGVTLENAHTADADAIAAVKVAQAISGPLRPARRRAAGAVRRPPLPVGPGARVPQPGSHVPAGTARRTGRVEAGAGRGSRGALAQEGGAAAPPDPQRRRRTAGDRRAGPGRA